MTDQPANPLKPIEKAKEEEYFRRQNAELAARLKARAEMKESGISDEKLADQIIAAGFTKDSVRALDFVPIVEVAWADGRLQDEERLAISKLLEARGIPSGSEAHKLVSSWLASKPSDEKYYRAKSLVDPLLEESKKTGGTQWVLTAAERVAGVTGGVFGLVGNKISASEKAVLEKLSKKLR